MYIVFEVAYIALFALFGVSSIAGLKSFDAKEILIISSLTHSLCQLFQSGMWLNKVSPPETFFKYPFSVSSYSLPHSVHFTVVPLPIVVPSFKQCGHLYNTLCK